MTVNPHTQADEDALSSLTYSIRLAYALSKDDRDMSKYRYDRNTGILDWDRIRDAAFVEFDNWLAAVAGRASVLAVVLPPSDDNTDLIAEAEILGNEDDHSSSAERRKMIRRLVAALRGTAGESK